tara:strand:- start:28 stop:1239 length:1212 start_codon:yes stop_codon:yes gene_type:complete
VKFAAQLILIIIFSSFLASCSVLNFNFFSSKKPTPAPLEKFDPKINLSEKWTIQVGPNNVLNSGIGSFGPQVTKNRAITTSGSGVISAYDLSNGNQIWKISLDQKVLCSVGYRKVDDDELIAAISEMGELILLKSTGKVNWASKLDGIVRVPPVITNSVVVTLYADNRVVAYDLISGKRIWAVKRRAPPLILHGQSGMTLISSSKNSTKLSSDFENGLIVNMAGGRMVFLNATTGTVNWESRIAFSRGTNEVERISDLLGNPHVDNDVCTTAYQNSLVCLSLLNGEVLWRKAFNSVQPAFFSDASVIAIDSDSKLSAFRRNEKNLLWKSEKFFLRKISAPVIWQSAVWFVDGQGYLHGLSLFNGKVISRYKLKDGLLSGMIKIVQDGILIQTAGGQLVLLKKT